jgi:hypothetical protein
MRAVSERDRWRIEAAAKISRASDQLEQRDEALAAACTRLADCEQRLSEQGGASKSANARLANVERRLKQLSNSVTATKERSSVTLSFNKHTHKKNKSTR